MREVIYAMRFTGQATPVGEARHLRPLRGQLRLQPTHLLLQRGDLFALPPHEGDQLLTACAIQIERGLHPGSLPASPHF
jgi:hypothetical protein